MTISKLAQLNKANGGCFFDRTSMKAAGETQKSFTIRTIDTATVEVTRKKDDYKWLFDTKTGRIQHAMTVENWMAPKA